MGNLPTGGTVDMSQRRLVSKLILECHMIGGQHAVVKMKGQLSDELTPDQQIATLSAVYHSLVNNVIPAIKKKMEEKNE